MKVSESRVREREIGKKLKTNNKKKVFVVLVVSAKKLGKLVESNMRNSNMVSVNMIGSSYLLSV